MSAGGGDLERSLRWRRKFFGFAMPLSALEAGNPRPAPGQPETPINGLADGKFATALQDVVTRRGSGVQRKPGGEPGPGASVHMRPPPASLTQSRVAIRSAWQISLEAPSVAAAGQPVILRARVIATSDAVPALTRVCWYVNDVLVKEEPKRLEYVLLVPKAVTLAVRVEAEAESGQPGVARLGLWRWVPPTRLRLCRTSSSK